jgi:hypothetical protein
MANTAADEEDVVVLDDPPITQTEFSVEINAQPASDMLNTFLASLGIQRSAILQSSIDEDILMEPS